MKNETVTTKENLSSEVTPSANGIASKNHRRNLKKLSVEQLENYCRRDKKQSRQRVFQCR